MKKAIFASIAVAMLTACSQDEVVLVNNDANAIRFGVTTESASRAADVYCQNNRFTKFNVYATYNNAVYIDNDEIEYKNNAWTNNSGLRYWPNTNQVTFYGFVNGELDNTVTDATAPKFTTFAPANNVADQVDLLYARKTQGKTVPTDGSAVTTPQQVTLNFRHALSQIVFNARNDNANLYVKIKGVSVVNVKGNGVYSLPTADTDVQLDHGYDADATYPTTGRGGWTFADTVTATSHYSVSLGNGIAIEYNGTETDPDATAISLTDWTTHDAATSKSMAMLLIPQTTDAYNVAVADTEKDENDKYTRSGSYFLVDCQIWNVAGDEFNENTDVCLWNKGNVMIPVKFEWEEGKKYLYTFVFGNGNGGYDPDPTDPTPDPVLVPITFNVTVDEFFNVDNGNIETGRLNDSND